MQALPSNSVLSLSTATDNSPESKFLASPLLAHQGCLTEKVLTGYLPDAII
jgi:hypothetical protein